MTSCVSPVRMIFPRRLAAALALLVAAALAAAQDSDVPSAPETAFDRGMSLMAAGDSAGAEKAFRDALRLDPEHLNAALALAKLLCETGDPAAAYDFLVSLPLPLRSQPAVSLWLGVCSWNLEKHDRSVRILKPLASSPDPAIRNTAAVYAAMSLLSLDRRDEASALLESLPGDAADLPGMALRLKEQLAAGAASDASGAAAAAGMELSFGYDSSISSLMDLAGPTGLSSDFVSAGAVFANTWNTGGTGFEFVGFVQARYFSEVPDLSVVHVDLEAGFDTGPSCVSLGGLYNRQRSGEERLLASLSCSSDRVASLDRNSDWPRWKLTAHVDSFSPDAVSGSDGWGVEGSFSPPLGRRDAALNLTFSSYRADDDALSNFTLGLAERIDVRHGLELELYAEHGVYPDGETGGGMRKDLMAGAGLTMTFLDAEDRRCEVGFRLEQNLSDGAGASYTRRFFWVSFTCCF
ncbi:MAG: tetratricopeptide repeat protein [Planctomycetes bacterium]|nr:tetratricopeptide repeat protein [Planctomycetota bacterium]